MVAQTPATMAMRTMPLSLGNIILLKENGEWEGNRQGG